MASIATHPYDIRLDEQRHPDLVRLARFANIAEGFSSYTRPVSDENTGLHAEDSITVSEILSTPARSRPGTIRDQAARKSTLRSSSTPANTTTLYPTLQPSTLSAQHVNPPGTTPLTRPTGHVARLPSVEEILRRPVRHDRNRQDHSSLAQSPTEHSIASGRRLRPIGIDEIDQAFPLQPLTPQSDSASAPLLNLRRGPRVSRLGLANESLPLQTPSSEANISTARQDVTVDKPTGALLPVIPVADEPIDEFDVEESFNDSVIHHDVSTYASVARHSSTSLHRSPLSAKQKVSSIFDQPYQRPSPATHGLHQVITPPDARKASTRGEHIRLEEPSSPFAQLRIAQSANSLPQIRSPDLSPLRSRKRSSIKLIERPVDEPSEESNFGHETLTQKVLRQVRFSGQDTSTPVSSFSEYSKASHHFVPEAQAAAPNDDPNPTSLLRPRSIYKRDVPVRHSSEPSGVLVTPSSGRSETSIKVRKSSARRRLADGADDNDTYFQSEASDSLSARKQRHTHEYSSSGGQVGFSTNHKAGSFVITHLLESLPSMIERTSILIQKLVAAFPAQAALLTVPGSTSPTLANTVHVFVDYSNIRLGFLTHLREENGLSSNAPLSGVRLSFANLVRIMQRGRALAYGFLGTSKNNNNVSDAALAEAESLGYNVTALDRRMLTPGEESAANTTGGNGSGSGAANGHTPVRARRKRKEQYVDELIQSRMSEAVLGTGEKFEAGMGPTMVLASGDGNEAEYSAGFVPRLADALRFGWMVEVVASRRSLSGRYRKLRAEWPGQVRIVLLDEFTRELIAN